LVISSTRCCYCILWVMHGYHELGHTPRLLTMNSVTHTADGLKARAISRLQRASNLRLCTFRLRPRRTVRVLYRNLRSEMPLVPRHARLKLLHACDQYHSSRVFTTSYRLALHTPSKHCVKVHNDCVGWSSYAKNWSFVKEALEVMCGEYKLKGARCPSLYHGFCCNMCGEHKLKGAWCSVLNRICSTR
jgi:hypothetical protein